MPCETLASFDCIKAFSETDFAQDLKQCDRPTLIIHGDEDDQIVPISADQSQQDGRPPEYLAHP